MWYFIYVKKNGIAKIGQQTIITMKDLLFSDSRHLLDFQAKTINTTNYLQNKLLTKS